MEDDVYDLLDQGRFLQQGRRGKDNESNEEVRRLEDACLVPGDDSGLEYGNGTILNAGRCLSEIRKPSPQQQT